MTGYSFVLKSLCVMIIGFAACVLVMSWIDPFNLFHEITPARYITSQDRFAKARLPVMKQYDSYVLGNSTAGCFRLSQLDHAFNANFAHLTLGGATSYEEKKMLHLIQRSHLNYLILNVSFRAYHQDMDQKAQPVDYPDYLYDAARFNDIKAYCSMNDFLRTELYQAAWFNWKGVDKRGLINCVLYNGYQVWEPKSWVRSEIRQRMLVSPSEMTDHEVRFSSANFLDMLRYASPRFKTIFVYFDPTSTEALWSLIVSGNPRTRLNYLAWKKELIRIASRYSNVYMVDYQTVNRITMDLNNYWDYEHYRPQVVTMLTEDFCSLAKTGHLKHPDFGNIATLDYAEQLRLDPKEVQTKRALRVNL